ncbi:MAG: hypothetical protein ACFFCD_01375 [Promethearchaeota archaeon]
MTLFMVVLDVDAGYDKFAYELLLKNLEKTERVIPLFIGQIFETADLEIMIQATDVDSLNEFILKRMRSIKEIRETMVYPITSFKGLAEFSLANFQSSYSSDQDKTVEFPLFTIKLDVAPTKDVGVYQTLSKLSMTDTILPAFVGYTFQQADFDIGFYFFAMDLQSAWDFVQGELRSIDGVWDTEIGVVIHIQSLVSAEDMAHILHE